MAPFFVGNRFFAALMLKLNVLIVGGGGREHALAWKISQSPLLASLHVAPGNGGTAQLAMNHPVADTDLNALAQLCIEQKIHLVIVGPEGPLVAGLRDHFQSNPETALVAIVGPGAQGAQLEGSKAFSKAFMARHGIPTAAAAVFSQGESKKALEFLATQRPPFVLKADGLAAGKGVIITDSIAEAESAVLSMLDEGLFGAAGRTLLIEQFLLGMEVSIFALTDGHTYSLLPEAKDYKRIGDNDTGPNTGGMGAVSPVVFADRVFMDKVVNRIVEPTIAGLAAEGIPYRGFVFFGLINVGGDPFVIEYNCRLGDPETECILPRIESDLLEHLWQCATGDMSHTEIKVSPNHSQAVVVVAGGYPGEYAKGYEVHLPRNTDPALVFQAGTKMSNEKTLTNGGRVAVAVAIAPNAQNARKEAYEMVQKVKFQDSFHRTDIGSDLLRAAT